MCSHQEAKSELVLIGTAACHLCAKGGQAGPEHTGWERMGPELGRLPLLLTVLKAAEMSGWH